MNYKPILLLLIITGLISCQKELNFDNSPFVPPVNDSIYVSQLVALDTNRLSSRDTVYKYLAYFDAQKRITSEMFIEFNSSGFLLDTFWIFKHTYPANDSLPSKSIGAFSEYLTSANFDTSYNTYASTVNRELAYDSLSTQGVPPSFPYFNQIARVFQYSTDLVQVYHRYYDNNVFTGYDTLIVHYNKSNGNIVSQQDTLGYVPTSGFYSEANHYTVTYDNKVNPLRRLNRNFPYLSYNIPFLVNNLQGNNATEINTKQIYPFTPDYIWHYQYSYKYRDDGYPLEIIAKDLGSTTPIGYNKIKYFYTK